MKRARRGRGREAFLDSIVNLSEDKKRWLQQQYCATNVDFHSRLLYRARSDCATVIIRSMSPYICFVRVVKAVKVSLCESQVLRHIIALRNIVSNLWNCRNKHPVRRIWFDLNAGCLEMSYDTTYIGRVYPACSIPNNQNVLFDPAIDLS